MDFNRVENLFSLRQFRLAEWRCFVYSTTRNAPYVHRRLDLIRKVWRIFPNAILSCFGTWYFVRKLYFRNPVPIPRRKDKYQTAARWKTSDIIVMLKLGPSINGLVTDGNTKSCCRGFVFNAISKYKNL